MIEAKAFFDRADLQQMIHFLLYGKEDANKNKGKYEARIHTASIGILEKMHDLNLERDVYEKITDDIFRAFKVYEEVYTEIGFKMGARMLFQIMCEDEKCGFKQ